MQNRIKKIRAKEKRTLKTERKILWISFVAGLFFAIAELISAVYTRSQSVLTDAVYDASELIIIILTLFLTPLFHKPLNEKHPYGYAQVESLFIIVKVFMMMSVTLVLTANNINVALAGGNKVDEKAVSIFQLGVGIACLCVYLLLRYLNHSVSSPTAQTEILGWKLDVGYGLGMSIAFYASSFLERTPLAFIAPYFDQIMAVVIMISILPENIKLLKNAIVDLFLFSPEEEIMDKIKEISDETLKDFDFEPLFYDVTRTGRRYWVYVYFTVESRSLYLPKLDEATLCLESKLMKELENCSVDLIAVSGETEKQMEYYNDQLK